MLLHFLCFIRRQDPLSLCCPVRLLYFFFAAAWSSQSPFPLQVLIFYCHQKMLLWSNPPHQFRFQRMWNICSSSRQSYQNFLLTRHKTLPRCFSVFIGSSLYQRTKPPQGAVLFINLLGTGLTPRAYMGDGGSI